MSDYKGREAWQEDTVVKETGPSPAAELRNEHYELGNVVLPEAPRPQRQGTSVVPWLLFVATLLAMGAFFVLVHQPLKREAEARAQALATALADGEKLSRRVQELEQKRTELEAEQAELAVTVQVKEQALAELTRAQEELAKKLEQEISMGDVRIKQHQGQLVVDLVDQILFDSGEAELNEQGKSVLAKVGETFVKVEGKVIQVGGHTDDVPISDKLRQKFASNWELSAARALHVVRYLQDTVKVPGGRLAAAGFSQYRPIASNNTKSGRKKNRRIEVVLLPSVEAAKASKE